MKKIKFGIIICLIIAASFAGDVYAQSGPPPWAPAHGYRAKARYTYFPALNFYFDTRTGLYFTQQSGKWVGSKTIPAKYKSYSWSKYKHEEFEWSSQQPWEKHHGKVKSTINKPKTYAKPQGKSNGKGNGKGKN